MPCGSRRGRSTYVPATETILSQVVRIFGEAQPHHAYLFASRRGNRLKVLVHDGYGVWLANRRLNQGRFQLRPCDGSVALTRGQFDALILGLGSKRVSSMLKDSSTVARSL